MTNQTTFSYEEAQKATLDYFGGREFSSSIFLSKYGLRNHDNKLVEKTPDDMHRRLAREFARIEAKYPNPLSEDEIYSYFKDFRYIIPQGGPMAGIGDVYRQVSYGNCYVVPSPLDSYSSIIRTDEMLAQVSKRRGGVGVDISNIRPKNTRVNNAARTSTGIGPFMERYSNTIREVGQGGRRGALMISISVHHPEIETFIEIKQDETKVTGANVSIRLTDRFMQAVVEDKTYVQQWPIDSKSPVVVKEVKARDIWNKICKAAWAKAEPGLLFWDTVLTGIADCYPEFRSISTNPCQPGWASVLTPEGIKTFNDIDIGSVIWSGRQWTKVTNKVCTGVKPVAAYCTNAGIFYGTENHRVISGGERVEVKDAKSIDTSQGPIPNTISSLDPRDIMDGLVFGDGTFHKASNSVYLIIGDGDQSYFDSEVKSLLLESRSGVGKGYWRVATSHKTLEKTYKRSLDPDWLHGCSEQQKRGFLRGLFTANGTVVGNRVQLKTTSLKLVRQVQLVLSSLGIASYYTTNKSHEVKFGNGNYMCRESYDLSIGTKEGRRLFQKLIGFIHPLKQSKLLSSLEIKDSCKSPKKTYEIVGIEKLGYEKVYDITVEAEEHTYWTGGLLVSNCSEIPMSVDSCRLLVVNLAAFVLNSFTSSPSFDWHGYARVARVAQRLMDDLVDLELEAIDRIIAKVESDPEPRSIKNVELDMWKMFKSSAEQGRRTGLGPVAVGDTIAMLNQRYGSDESIVTAEELYKQLQVNAYRESINMAKERGAFPAFNKELEKDNPMLQRVLAELTEEEVQDYYKYGRRNVAHTTTAPTGSVAEEALLSSEHRMFGVTSGIEPAIFVESERKKKINPNDENTRVDEVDGNGDKWQKYYLYHQGYKLWKQLNPESPKELSPYFKGTSDDIDWVTSVKLQGAAQKWVDHAISKTCNLPANATEEMVREVYLEAWKHGLKGFTVYRAGSRDGVINQVGANKPQVFQQHNSPKRPDELVCEVHHASVQGEKWTIFVGLMEGKPFEIFGGLAKLVSIPKRVKTGKIIKHNGHDNTKAKYDFHFDYEKGPEDETIVRDIGKVFENVLHEAFTRTISLSLRHGVPVQFVVEQLLKGSEQDSDLQSFARVTSRVLKKYITDGTKVTENTCSECKAVGALVYREGCSFCTSCGYSKCS